MVSMTRHQEAMLQKQYKVQHGSNNSIDGSSDQGQSSDEKTPPAKTKDVVLPDGRKIKSAMKQYTTERPWDSEQKPRRAPIGDRLRKTVRILSKHNIVHVFEPQESDSDDEDAHRKQHTSNDDNDDEEDEDIFNIDPEKAKSFIFSALALLTWAVSSSWLIFFNRDLMRYKGFPFPLFLPGFSQFCCALMSWGVGRAGLIPVRPWPPARDIVTMLLPLALSSVACMFLGNFAYLGLSVAFLSILKALTPATTLAVSALAGMEEFTTVAFFSTLLIAYGTGVATIQETAHNADFHWPAFISFTTSIIFESTRVVFAARLLGKMDKSYNPVEVLAHVGTLVGMIMCCASFVVEREGLMALGVSGWLKLVPELMVVNILSFLVNIASYYSIQFTSSTTFKVVGRWSVLCYVHSQTFIYCTMLTMTLYMICRVFQECSCGMDWHAARRDRDEHAVGRICVIDSRVLVVYMGAIIEKCRRTIQKEEELNWMCVLETCLFTFELQQLYLCNCMSTAYHVLWPFMYIYYIILCTIHTFYRYNSTMSRQSARKQKEATTIEAITKRILDDSKRRWYKFGIFAGAILTFVGGAGLLVLLGTPVFTFDALP